MTTWTKLPEVSPGGGCAHCGGADEHLELTRTLENHCWGNAGVTCDGETVWMDEGPITVAWVEKIAAADPDRDWRIWFRQPLYDAEYQRQDGRWVLVSKGEGFM